jgi:WD40 repeat protein
VKSYPRLSAALLSGGLSVFAACGGGVFSDPTSPPLPDSGGVGGGADGGFGADASPDSGPRLPGNWIACGKMGTGGPGAIALSADGGVVAILFVEGQLAVHRVADATKLLEIADAFGPPRPDFDPSEAPSPDYRFFQSHTLALAPDGSSVMVQDATHVAAWQISSGQQLFDLPGSFVSPAIDPGASTFVVLHKNLVVDGGVTSVVELRTMSDGSLVHQYAGDGVASVGFGDGGRQVLMAKPRFAACGSLCGEIETFAADAGGALVAVAVLAQDDPSAGRFSPSGKYFAGFAAPQAPGTPDELRVLDTTDGHRVASFSIDGDDLAFSPDETNVLAFYSNRTDMCCTNIANIDTGDRAGAGTDSQTTAAALGPGANPTFVLDRTGVYWTTNPWAPFTSPDYRPFVRFPTLPGQGLSFMAATASPDGQWLATTSIDGASPPFEDVTLWDLRAARGERVLTSVTAANVAFSPDGSRALLAGPRDGLTLDVTSLREWPLDGDTADWTIGGGDTVRSAAYGPDGTQVIAALGSGIQSMRVGETVLSANIAVGEPSLAMALHPDGDRLAVSGPELWRVSDQRRIWPADPGTGQAPPGPGDGWLAFSPDGRMLVTSDFQSTASPPWNSTAYPDARGSDNYSTHTRLYGVDDAGLTLLVDIGPGLPRRPVFSPDGAWILAGNVLFSLESQGSKSLPLSLGYLQVSISTFAPDGTIAIGREDGVIELFCPR